MNITNYKTGFTIATSNPLEQVMITIVTYLSTTGRTIMTHFITNAEITYNFPKDGLYEIHQFSLWTNGTAVHGYSTVNNLIYFNGIEVTDLGNLLDDPNMSILDSLKVIVITLVEKCYSDLIKKILDSKIKKSCSLTYHEEEIKDMLQMALAVIGYAAELGMVYQAQRIIESITASCDICNFTNVQKCGCNE